MERRGNFVQTTIVKFIFLNTNMSQWRVLKKHGWGDNRSINVTEKY